MRAPEHAARLLDDLRPLLDPTDQLAAHAADVPPDEDWIASGGADLTGVPGCPSPTVPGSAAAAVRGALAVLAAAVDTSPAQLPGVEIIGERAALTGLRRNGPWSCGGRFRGVRAADGWVGLSLARDADCEAVPALVGRAVVEDPWTAVSEWAAHRPAVEVEQRCHLLDLPAATIPLRPLPERRAPVRVAALGTHRARPVAARVVDLSALWAGPLAARLLRASGADVTAVQNVRRVDPTRRTSPAFHRRLRDGCRSTSLDFERDRALLDELLDGADVVITSSRVRALHRLGIDVDAGVARGTVWVHISAYGTASAEDAERVGFGDDVAAGAGLVAWFPDHDAIPLPAGDALGDPLTGVFAAAAAAVALRRGRGAFLDVSMHDVCRRARA